MAGKYVGGGVGISVVMDMLVVRSLLGIRVKTVQVTGNLNWEPFSLAFSQLIQRRSGVRDVSEAKVVYSGDEVRGCKWSEWVYETNTAELRIRGEQKI